jgi:galactitol-specific phosphotransferase system IIB component
MNNISILASRAIERAKNLQEFLVYRDMEDIIFCSTPIPYTLNHVVGKQVEITVPAISQDEAETRVSKWLQGQRG